MCVFIQVCTHPHTRNVSFNFYKMVFTMRPHIIICQLDLDLNKRFRALSSQIKNSQEETSVLLQRKSKCNSLYPTQNTAAGQDLMGIVAQKKKIFFVSHTIIKQQKSSEANQGSQEQKQFHPVTEATVTQVKLEFFYFFFMYKAKNLQVLKLSYLNHIEHLPVSLPYTTFVVLKRRHSHCRFQVSKLGKTQNA